MSRTFLVVVLASSVLLVGSSSAGEAHVAKTAEYHSILQLLNESLDTRELQNPMTLKEGLGWMMEKFAKKGKELPILVDMSKFKEENPEAASIYDTQVQFAPFPKQLTALTILRTMLSRVDPPNATFLIRGGIVEITTKNAGSTEALLKQTILANFHKAPIGDVLEELSVTSGASIILDQRLADKLKTPVSASFKNDFSLKDALRVLTDMAGLKTVFLPAGIYVTSPENAASMAKELANEAAREARRPVE